MSSEFLQSGTFHIFNLNFSAHDMCHLRKMLLLIQEMFSNAVKIAIPGRPNKQGHSYFSSSVLLVSNAAVALSEASQWQTRWKTLHAALRPAPSITNSSRSDVLDCPPPRFQFLIIHLRNVHTSSLKHVKRYVTPARLQLFFRYSHFPATASSPSNLGAELKPQGEATAKVKVHTIAIR